MADEFSFTDSDDERAVEDIISQAMDHSVLEQITKLNCSTDDHLPSDLEHRFRKLKSLPTPRSGNLMERNRDSNAKSKSISNSSRELKSKSKLKSNSGSGSFSSWSVSSAEESRSVSPVRRSIGCFFCSPKKENRSDVEFVKTFSKKEKKRIMRKAMKEEEKVAKEVNKIVEWAKQASGRMMDVNAVVRDEMLLFSDVEDDD